MGLSITDIFVGIDGILDKFIPDANQKVEAKLKLAQLEQELMKGQIETNKAEASHPSIFVAGWRPACGWIGAFGLAYSFVVEPIASWTATVIFKYAGNFPALSTGDLMWLVGGMLGFGGWRTIEKVKGVAREENPIKVNPNSPTPVEPPKKKKKGLDLWPF